MTMRTPQQFGPLHLSEVAARISALPDIFALIHLDLQVVCGDGREALTKVDRTAVKDACSRLHEAIQDVGEIAEAIDSMRIQDPERANGGEGFPVEAERSRARDEP